MNIGSGKWDFLRGWFINEIFLLNKYYFTSAITAATSFCMPLSRSDDCHKL